MADKNTQPLAVITGGASGIGLSTVKRFLDEGYEVLILDANKDAGEQSVNNLKSDTCKINFAHIDITNHAQIDSVFADLHANNCPAHVLVNCAGTILRDGKEFTLDGFEQVLDVNLTGTMRMCTSCLPLLAKQQGCVLNIASMLSYFGSEYAPAYSSSKGGIVQLTRS